ncbi:hypothetical protein [Pseudoalteromonas sp. 1_2015MBL_MicDiv]|uniref:hypothetical protein n=1 Tax=Pseudoalteromonas sp. 1_2015MBL_MicDiv TaxID=1720343 RepID=UPI000BBE6D8B|nr:hypothetical protein [Pseudoalteromonas sp. 1_2015MBL_MicDiv]ATG77638.1 hypothetical protein AOR04_08875 [Pseudoalteromonas sp. 1_2015MBL_MicDiv]
MFKSKLKIVTLLCAALTVCNVAALTPLKDRAVIQYMNADILLPDNSTLNVDMSFDCGSDFAKTAMIVTSEAGAYLLANAFSNIYGPAAGQRVLDTWNTKTSENDPRKPTFLVITPPPEGTENWYKSTISKGDKKLLNNRVEMLTSEGDHAPEPMIMGVCGSRDHVPTGQQLIH